MITAFLIIAAIVFVPWLVSRLLRLDRWIPLPMLQIAFGIIAGPSALGALYPELFTSLFTAPVRASLDTIQTLAIVIFSFIAGVELKPREILRSEGSKIWYNATGVVLLPILLAAACFYLLFDHAQWRGAGVDIATYAWAMGVATCITAIPMLVVTCKRLGIYGTDYYRNLLAIVVFDDLILWLTVSLIVAFGHTLLLAAAFALLVVIAYYLWPRLLAWAGEGSWPTLTVAMVLVMSAASYAAGLHWVLGALFAGMITPRWAVVWNRGMEEQQMYWLMPVFFVWTGLKTQWDVAFGTVFAAALLMLLVAVATKFVGVWTVYRQQGLQEVMFKTALLQTKGLMEIFLATILLNAGIISSNLFAAVVIMSLISTVMAVPLARCFQRSMPSSAA